MQPYGVVLGKAAAYSSSALNLSWTSDGSTQHIAVDCTEQLLTIYGPKEGDGIFNISKYLCCKHLWEKKKILDHSSGLWFFIHLAFCSNQVFHDDLVSAAYGRKPLY